jgi:uncharacterized lipoprotein YajG
MVLSAILLGSLLLTGCATQQLDLSKIQQATPTTGQQTTHFKESSYSVYMLLDLIPVRKATVDDIVLKANPANKPVANLKVTSKADVGAVLVNLLNGGIIDRGVIVSLNKVTVEGDIVE